MPIRMLLKERTKSDAIAHHVLMSHSFPQSLFLQETFESVREDSERSKAVKGRGRRRSFRFSLQCADATHNAVVLNVFKNA